MLLYVDCSAGTARKICVICGLKLIFKRCGVDINTRYFYQYYDIYINEAPDFVFMEVLFQGYQGRGISGSLLLLHYAIGKYNVKIQIV